LRARPISGRFVQLCAAIAANNIFEFSIDHLREHSERRTAAALQW